MRRWYFGIGMLAFLVLAVLFGLELKARSWETKWLTFRNRWEAKGESFGVENHLPPAMEDVDEFAFHPWIRNIVNGDSEVLERLRKMEPENVTGYSEWLATEAPEAPEGVRPPMPLDLAKRLSKHGTEFGRELDAFADALDRPGSRISPWDAKGTPTSADWVKHLKPMFHLLEGLSHAAIAMDDSRAFTKAIETSMRAGQKLRASNLTLPTVVGCGFEAAVYQSLQSLPEPLTWPQSERSKWIAALDYRERNLTDEYQAGARVERGLFLRIIQDLEIDAARGMALPRFNPFRRVFRARAKLLPCEAMQNLLLAPEGKTGAPADPDDIARFEAYAGDKKHKSDPALSFGLLILVTPRLGIHKALLIQENDRASIRKKLMEAQ